MGISSTSSPHPHLPWHPFFLPPCEGRHSPAFCLRLIPLPLLWLPSPTPPQGPCSIVQPTSLCILNPSLSTGTFSAFNTKVQVSPSYSQETTPSINPPTLTLSSYFLKDFSVLLASHSPHPAMAQLPGFWLLLPPHHWCCSHRSLMTS